MSKIGVFICHCGTNIGGVIDIDRVVEFAKTLPGSRLVLTINTCVLTRVKT